jgi:predicted GNAT family acetyltransferase
MICKKIIGDLLLLSLKNEKSEHLATIPYLENGEQKVFALKGDCFLQGNYTTEEDHTKIFIITNLFTSDECRGCGYATQILLRAIDEVKENNCKCIKLTDCSDWFKHSKNIYIKHGFIYDNDGSPEMTLYIN